MDSMTNNLQNFKKANGRPPTLGWFHRQLEHLLLEGIIFHLSALQ
jgi:hypothetical protein